MQPDMFSDERRAVHGRPENWIVDTPPELRGETRIILNAETTGLRWWEQDRPIGWAYKLPESGRMGYLPMRHKTGDNLSVEQVHAWLRSIRGLHVENINTKFDLHMARADGVDLVAQDNTFGDAAHHAALLDDHRARFGVDQLSKNILDWDVSGDLIPTGIESEGDFQELPPWTVAPYAMRNVEQVSRLIDTFEPDIVDQQLENVLELEQQIIPVVVEMESNGTYLDMELLHEWQKKAARDLEDKMWFVFQETGLRLSSPDSPKDLAKLFAHLNIPITSYTPTGKPSFTDAVMRELSHPCIQAVRAAGQLADLKSKYLDKYAAAARSDGWLRFNLHQLRYGKDEGDDRGTVSGRFSAAGDRNGGYNPQQVVAVEKQLERGWCRDFVIRKLFRPTTGHLWLSADAKQIEYRLFAHYANDPKILAAYAANPDADFHAVVMELLHQVAPHLNRKLVKNVNFAKIYGAGLVKFAFMLGLITEAQYVAFVTRQRQRDFTVKNDSALAEARTIDDAYNEMFPAVGPLLRMASNTAEKRGYVKTILGRRARLYERYHSALNRIIQGGAADVNKRVLVEVYKQRKALGLTLRLTVHDEVDADVADKILLPEIANVLNTQYIDLKVPILWDIKIGPTWADCK